MVPSDGEGFPAFASALHDVLGRVQTQCIAAKLAEGGLPPERLPRGSKIGMSIASDLMMASHPSRKDQLGHSPMGRRGSLCDRCIHVDEAVERPILRSG